MNYQPSLVILSICISIFGSYTALNLSLRMQESEKKWEFLWILASACTMGFGTWSMHFTGILALMSLHHYNWPLTFASLMIAIIGSALAFSCSNNINNKRKRILISGTIFGLTIPSMHYTGMSAIESHSKTDYDPIFVVLSILVALVLSIFAMAVWEKIKIPQYQTTFYTLVSSFLLGLAVSGMHYSVMGHTMSYMNRDVKLPTEISNYSVSEDVIFTLVVGVTVFLFATALLLSNISQRNFQQKMKLKEIKFLSLYENNLDPIIIFDEKGKFVKANQIAWDLSKNDLSRWLSGGIKSFVKESDQTLVENHFSEALKGKASKFLFTFLNEDGLELLLHVKQIPIVLEGKSHGFFAIVHDISEQNRTEKKLKETTERLESFFNETNDAINVTTADSKVIYLNPAFEKMFGWRKEELIGQELPIHRDGDKKERDKVQNTLENKEHITNYETKLKRKDGTLIDVSLTLSPISDENGKLIEIAAITRDITEQKKAEAAMREKDEHYRLITEHSTDLIRIVGEDETIQYASPSHEAMLGHAPVEMVGRNLLEFVAPDNHEKVRNLFVNGIKEKKRNCYEMQLIEKNGQPFWVETNTVPLFDENGSFIHYISISRNISERKQYEEQLKQMAYYDSLTDIPNRRLFFDRLSQTLRKAKRNHTHFAVFYLDCDRFKWINDTYGHDTGDQLLKGFVDRVAGCIRETDTLARLGGDEFAIILDDFSTSNEVEVVAKRIIHELQAPWAINGHEFITTSSIGIAIFPGDGNDADTLLGHADQALYLSKEKGRNMYHFHTE